MKTDLFLSFHKNCACIRTCGLVFFCILKCIFHICSVQLHILATRQLAYSAVSLLYIWDVAVCQKKTASESKVNLVALLCRGLQLYASDMHYNLITVKLYCCYYHINIHDNYNCILKVILSNFMWSNLVYRKNVWYSYVDINIRQFISPYISHGNFLN